MNKKFLSAILFGALAVASTGSFVSCKDYDDDIKNLQTQIGQLASKSELQEKVTALESSLTAAKSSAESAAKTAQQAVADAKAAQSTADSKLDEAAVKAIAEAAAKEAKAAAEKAQATADGKLSADEVTAIANAAAQAAIDAAKKAQETADSKITAEEAAVIAQAAAQAAKELAAQAQATADSKLGEEEVLTIAEAAAKAAADAAAKTVGDQLALAENRLALAEDKLTAIETELAAVKAMKAELESYTDEQVEALKNDLEAQIAGLKTVVEGLVGVHYVDLMITPAFMNQTTVAYSAKFAPKGKSGYLTDYKKTLLVAFPELAELEGKELVEAGNVSVVVAPAVAEMMPEYTYELINAKEEAVPVSLSNPTKGIVTRASGSEYWSLEVAPTFDEKGKVNEVCTLVEDYKSPAGPFALRVSEGDETLYKSQFGFNALVTEADVAVEITANDASADYAPEIELVNSELIVAGKATDKKFFDITNGYKDYYVIDVIDATGTANQFATEKYGISVEGSKLIIKNWPDNLSSVKVQLSMVALGINGSTSNTGYKTLTINKNVESTVELPAQSFEIGKTDEKDAEYLSLYYSVEDLGWTTPSQVYANKDVVVKVNDAEGNPFYTSIIKSFADKDKKYASNSPTNAKNVKYLVVKVKTKEFQAGEYTIELETKDTNNTVTFMASGDLTAVNTGSAIKVLETLCDENGVLQAVGTPEANGMISYDIDKALVYDVDFITLGGKNADNTDIKPLVDDDADEDDATTNWVKNETTINVHKNGVENEGQEDEVEYSDINSTVRNMTVNYYMGNNNKNVASLPIKVKMISAVYGQDVINVANQTIYFEASTDPKRTNSFDLSSDKVTTAKFAYGTNAGKNYNLFNTLSEFEGGKDGEKLPNYSDPKTTNFVVYAYDQNDKWVKGNADLLSKNGEPIEFPVSKLKEIELITANDAFYAEASVVYLAKTETNVYFKYKDPTTNEVSIRQSENVELTQSVSSLYTNWYKGVVSAGTKDQNDNTKYKVAEDGTVDWTYYPGKGAILVQFGEGSSAYYEWKTNGTTNDDTKMSTSAAAFEALRGLIAWNESDYTGKPTAENPAKVSGRHEYINAVSVKFDNELEAAKYINPTAYTAAELGTTSVDDFKAPKFTAKSDYEKTNLNNNQVTLTGTMTVEDAWGIKTVVPFQVTIMVNDAAAAN